MKRTLFILCAFTFVSFGLQAKKNSRIQNDSINFNQTTYDYGKVAIGGDGSCEFIFTNGMNTPLVVTSVKPSCGCTVANWTKSPIEPGKSGKIQIKYNTQISGPFHKTITVVSNAKNASVLLLIQGTVMQDK